MRAAILILCGFMLALAACETKVTETATPETKSDVKDDSKVKAELQMYNNAKELKDPLTATLAMHLMMAKDSTYCNYYDTLAQLYLTQGVYMSGLACIDKLLAKDPENEKYLDMAGQTEQILGRLDEAKAIYYKLYEKHKKAKYLYQIAVFQLNDENFDLALSSVQKVIADPVSASEPMSINLQDGSIQEVPLRAAALNLQGYAQVIQKEDLMKNKKYDAAVAKAQAAQKSFEDALRLAPDFQLPKLNLKMYIFGREKVRQ